MNRPSAKPCRCLSNRLEAAILLVILLVGLWLRWSYFQEIRPMLEFSHLQADPLFNDYWARGIATGNWASAHIQRVYGSLPNIQGQPFFRAPGYAYFLAAVYRILGQGYAVPRLVQMSIGMVNVLLAFVLGRGLYGRAAGLLAAGLMSVYWGFIYFEGELAEPSVIILLLLLFTYLLCRAAHKAALPNALLAGLVLGLAALMRGNVLLLAVPVLIWFRRAVGRRRGTSWKRAFVLGFLIALTAAVAPATIRNRLVSGEFVPLSSNLGINLYIGNNESADGTFVFNTSEFSRFRSCFDYPRIVEELEDRLGTDLTYSGASRYYTLKALEFLRRHPLQSLRLALRKGWLLVSPHEITLNKVVHFERINSRTLSRTPMNFPLVLALGVVGALFVSYRARSAASGVSKSSVEPAWKEEAALPPLLAGFYFLSLLPFFAASSYRIPAIPLLMLTGANWVCYMGRRLLARDWRVVVPWMVAFSVLLALASVSFIPYDPGLTKWHLARATTRALSGLDEEAMSEYEKALAVDPDSPIAHYNFGIVLARSGRLTDACAHLERAVELAPKAAAYHTTLGDVRAVLGRSDDAAVSYRRAIEIDSQSVTARGHLAVVLRDKGEFGESVSLLNEALAIDPDYAPSLRDLAWILAVSPVEELRDGERAVQLARSAIEITGRESPSLLATLAAAQAEVGDFDAAVASSERALALAGEVGAPTQAIADALERYRSGRPYRL